MSGRWTFDRLQMIPRARRHTPPAVLSRLRRLEAQGVQLGNRGGEALLDGQVVEQLLELLFEEASDLIRQLHAAHRCVTVHANDQGSAHMHACV